MAIGWFLGEVKAILASYDYIAEESFVRGARSKDRGGVWGRWLNNMSASGPVVNQKGTKLEMDHSSDMETRILHLERELKLLKARNLRVDVDKAWERSGFRITTITAITYLVATIVLWSFGAQSPTLSAIVPALGYLLSTQSMPRVKQFWVDRNSNS